MSIIDNPYFPLVPGTTFLYRGTEERQAVRNLVFVTDKTKDILGVTATVVRDRVFIDGELAEETFDGYAQDEDGMRATTTVKGGREMIELVKITTD